MCLRLWVIDWFFSRRSPGPVFRSLQCARGGTPLYKLYRYVPPHRVGFLRRFGLKTGIDFAHFGLESGMVCKGNTGVYERIYHFNSE